MNATDKSELIFTENNGEYYIQKNADQYFKVQNVGGTYYPFCDASEAQKTAWILEELFPVKPEQPDNISVPLYHITTKDKARGALYASASEGYLSHCGGTYNGYHHKDIAVNAEDAAQQFVVVEYEGKKYLYSVGAQRFTNDEGNYVKLTENPEQHITVAEDGDYKVILFAGKDRLNFSGGYTYGVFANYNNADDGNRLVFTEVGSFNATELLAAMEEYFHPAVQPEGEKLFNATTITDGQFAKSTTWYTMQIGASGLVIDDNGSSNHIALNNPKSDVNNAAQLWAFVGDNTYGYKLYNKQGGTAKVLAAPTTMNGTTGAESYPILVDANAVPEGYTDMWLFAASDKLGEGNTYFYMYEKGYPSNKVNNRGGKFAFWNTGADAGSTLNILFAETCVPVNSESGVFTISNPNNTWHSRWESSIVEGLSFATSANNMTLSNGSIAGYSGQSSTSTYTITAPEGIDVTGISSKYVNTTAEDYALTLTIDGNTFTSSSVEQAFNVNFETPARTAQFTQSGANKGITFNDLYITLKRAKDEAAAGTDIFVTLQGAIPYRIPAITLANNGDLIAVADYRPCGNDIGYGRVDLYTSISKDNGANWSAAQPIIEGQGWEVENKMYVGFGDPAIVADRESNRVLMLSCGGDITFQSGTPDHHQNIVRFYSNDNGATWSEPEDIAPSIYAMWDNSENHGPAKAMFVGSGKIHQSRYVKVNNYYRLYCSVLLRNKNNAYTNFVLYSDDFGGTWDVLGGVEVAPIPGGGDEPKVEELPNGNVVLSSRVSGGRLFNIFTFTDFENAEGSWATHATSNASNGGVVAKGNSTNGEILIMPAIRKADSEKVWIALQSVPFGNERANVGIFYKELASAEDYNTPANFAKEWDGSYQVSNMGSAYSTMCFQSDSTIAFLYEESTYGANYTIVYKNYTLEQITDSLYTISGDITMPESNTSKETLALIEKAKVIVGAQGVGYPIASFAGRATLQAAIQAAEANPTAEAGVELQNAIVTYCSTTEIELPMEGKVYTFTAVWGEKEYYIYNNNGTLAVAARGEGELPQSAKFVCEYNAEDEYKFQFKTLDGIYYLAYPTIGGKNWLDGESVTGLEKESGEVTKFNVNKILAGGEVKTTNDLLFGLIKMDGYRGYDNGKYVHTYGPIIVKHSATAFDGASAPYYNENFTSAIRIESCSFTGVSQTPKFYNIRSANITRNYVNNTAHIYTDASNNVKWANGYNAKQTNAVWTFEEKGTDIYAKNLHTGMYLDGLGVSEAGKKVVFSALGDGQYIIRANGNMLHAQSSGNDIAGYDCTLDGQVNKSNASAWYIDEVAEFGHTLSVSAAEWSTLILGYNAVIPAGVTCYAVSTVNGSYATLTEVEGILPANTAVLVNAAQGDYAFTYTATAAEATSMLGGTLYNKNVNHDGATVYVLSMVDGVVGLYPAKANDDGTVYNNANKAYLAIASTAKAIQFDFEGTTGIEEVENTDAEAVIYDLTGRRVQQMNAAGIYIVNGKKVLVK